VTINHADSWSIPNAAPYNALSSNRLEFMVKVNATCSSPYSPVIEFGIYSISYGTCDSNDLYVYSFGGARGAIVNAVSSSNWYLVRATFDRTKGTWWLETWNPDGTGYSATANMAATTNTVDASGSRAIGWTGTSVTFAWVRWCSGALPKGSPAPANYRSACDLADFELRGNLTDTSGHGLNLAISSPTYTGQPYFSPVSVAVCGDGWDPLYRVCVTRAGRPRKLLGGDSTSYSSTSALKHSWFQTAGPSELHIDSPSAVDVTVTGMMFGQYTVRHAVQDDTGASAYTDLTFGAVPTDEKGVVAHSDPKIKLLFGDQIMYGMSAWPFVDQSNYDHGKAFGDAVINKITYWNDDWRTYGPGTISVAADGNITGVGTDLRNLFCGGDVVWVSTYRHVIFYLPNGTKYFAPPGTCIDATHMTVSVEDASNMGAPYAGLTYALSDNLASWGCAWNGSGGADNPNYYDNVKGHYALYYRTGLTYFLTAARTLADRWYDSPCFLQGPNARVFALQGIMWRAYEGNKASWWTDKINAKIDYTAWLVCDPVRACAPEAPYFRLGDMREESYGASFLTVASVLSPDAGKRASWKATVSTLLKTRWYPQQTVPGNFSNLTYGMAPWDGDPGTIAVVNGSASVVGTGTAFGIDLVGNAFRRANIDGYTGDSVAYEVIAVNPGTQTLTLDRPYEGSTNPSTYFHMSNLVGVGSQPFIQGITSLWISQAKYALSDDTDAVTKANEMLSKLGLWQSLNGRQASSRGMWYGRDYTNCEPPSDSNKWCTIYGGTAIDDSARSAARYLFGEASGSYTHGYEASGDTTIKTAADDLMAACFGAPYGGPGLIDTAYCSELTTYLGQKPKTYGFFFGLSSVAKYGAARLGGPSAPAMRTLYLSVNPATVPGAVDIKVTPICPNGTTDSPVVCASSPCAIPVDRTEGDHRLQIEFRNGGGTTLRQVVMDAGVR
jgi:hypothetical protein